MTVDTVSQGGQLAVLTPTPSEAVNAAIEQWVGGLASSVKGAEYIVDTPLCPDAFWPLPPGTTVSKIPGKNPKVPLPNEERESYLARRQVATYTLGGVVRYGLQIGLAPEVAVQGIFMIGGRMAMYAEQMVALVKSRGHGHRIVERGRERCAVEVKRAGASEWMPFEFTIDDAISAGYVPGLGPNANLGKWPDGNPKTGGNEKYLLDPAAMLYARCSSIACRTEFPDVLRGLISYEEVQDEQASTPVVVTVEEPAPAPRVTAAEILGRSKSQDRRIELTGPLVREAAASVALDRDETHSVDSGPAEPEADSSGPVTDKQWRDIGTAFVRLGVTGPGQTEKRCLVMTKLAGKTVAERADLTAADATVILDTLAANGKAVVFEILNPRAAHQPIPAEPAPAAPPLPGQDEVDPEGDADYDPTTGGDWPPMDGAEAEAEGSRE